MPEKKEEVKTVELWEGKTVKVANEQLTRDYDFITELNDAQRNNDIKTIVSMEFALLEDGENLFNEVRDHIIEKTGVFDIQELGEILKKIDAVFPKATSPAQRRW